MTMIERVARALYEADPADDQPVDIDGRPTGPAFPITWDAVAEFEGGAVGIYREMARAAIQAMKEPTEAMVDAGVEAKTKLYEKLEAQGTNTRTLLVANHPAGTIYEAMIDAALSETSEEP